MEDRRLYPRVLDVSYSALITIYLSIAIIGYLMYGDACQEEITLNLGYSFASQLAVWVVVINPITKFALDMVRISHLYPNCTRTASSKSHFLSRQSRNYGCANG
jgi:hypothetical protein